MPTDAPTSGELPQQPPAIDALPRPEGRAPAIAGEPSFWETLRPSEPGTEPAPAQSFAAHVAGANEPWPAPDAGAPSAPPAADAPGTPGEPAAAGEAQASGPSVSFAPGYTGTPSQPRAVVHPPIQAPREPNLAPASFGSTPLYDALERASADPMPPEAEAVNAPAHAPTSSEADRPPQQAEAQPGQANDPRKDSPTMSNLDEAIKSLLSIEGATGAAIVDVSSGMALAQGGNPGFDLGVAAAGNSNVVSAKLRTMRDLGVKDAIEDILITLSSQYHLINVLNTKETSGLFIYLVLDRNYANLALARHKLKGVSADVSI